MPPPIGPASASVPASLTGYRWSPKVLEKVVVEFGIDSPVALLRAAVTIDNGNQYLNKAELTTAAQRVQAYALRGYRWSPRILQEVLTGANLTDAKAVLKKAAEHGDDNKYLNRSELEAGAAAVLEAHFHGYSYSDRVRDAVMDAYGIDDPVALVAEAKKHDNGNKYLNRSELEAAAKALSSGAPEIGYVSDLDKTIIPPHSDELPASAYPGVQAILHELEFKGSGTGGDAYYVTARTPDRLVGIESWMESHDLPDGPIDTGVSGVPWLAEKEKIKDISAILDAKPNQTFVLFGDSSHRDPEVMQKIKARYPGRISATFIHKVNNPSASRVEGLDLIENYAQAAATLFQRGVLDESAARRVMNAARAEGLAITPAEINTLISTHQPG